MTPPTSSGPSRGPVVFVVGNSRSGTTMMARMLGAHPSVFAFGEIHFFEQLWSPDEKDRRMGAPEAAGLMARLLAVGRLGYLDPGDARRFQAEAEEAVAGLDAPTPADVFEAFLFHETVADGREIPCEQTPRNVFYAGEILDLYPEARVVAMVRDPRDVLLSQKGKWRRRFLGAKGIPLKEALRSWANYHPVTISKLWNASAGAVARVADRERVLLLRFEDVLDDPEGALRKVCDSVGIAFEEGMLSVPRVGSSGGHDRPGETGVDRGRAGGWKGGGLSPTEVFLCQKITGPFMERYGYRPATAEPNLPQLVWTFLTLPVKLGLALVLNLGRMRNIGETIKRRLT